MWGELGTFLQLKETREVHNPGVFDRLVDLYSLCCQHAWQILSAPTCNDRDVCEHLGVIIKPEPSHLREECSCTRGTCGFGFGLRGQQLCNSEAMQKLHRRLVGNGAS